MFLHVFDFLCYRYGEIKAVDAPKANEIVVKILASPINPSDINMVCRVNE